MFNNKRVVITHAVLGLAFVFSNALYAAEKGGASQRVSFVPSANAAVPPGDPAGRTGISASIGEPLVFTAPPRESLDEATRIYQPVAQYLSQVLGRKVEYQHPKSWLSYQSGMAKGSYDIVFDEPHFNSWNITNQGHTTLAKVTDENVFVVVTRKDNAQITTLKQLAGKKVCAIGSSNIGALALLSEFEPMRQPLVIESGDWSKVYDGVAQGQCVAATLPAALLQKLDSGNATRTIHRSRTLPSQAFTAGPRIAATDQSKLANALISAEGSRALKPLLSANGANNGLALASKDEYAGMDVYLKDVWGLGRK